MRATGTNAPNSATATPTATLRGVARLAARSPREGSPSAGTFVMTSASSVEPLKGDLWASFLARLRTGLEKLNSRSNKSPDRRRNAASRAASSLVFTSRSGSSSTKG